MISRQQLRLYLQHFPKKHLDFRCCRQLLNHESKTARITFALPGIFVIRLETDGFGIRVWDGVNSVALWSLTSKDYNVGEVF